MNVMAPQMLYQLTGKSRTVNYLGQLWEKEKELIDKIGSLGWPNQLFLGVTSAPEKQGRGHPDFECHLLTDDETWIRRTEFRVNLRQPMILFGSPMSIDADAAAEGILKLLKSKIDVTGKIFEQARVYIRMVKGTLPLSLHPSHPSYGRLKSNGKLLTLSINTWNTPGHTYRDNSGKAVFKILDVEYAEIDLVDPTLPLQNLSFTRLVNRRNQGLANVPTKCHCPIPPPGRIDGPSTSNLKSFETDDLLIGELKSVLRKKQAIILLVHSIRAQGTSITSTDILTSMLGLESIGQHKHNWQENKALFGEAQFRMRFSAEERASSTSRSSDRGGDVDIYILDVRMMFESISGTIDTCEDIVHTARKLGLQPSPACRAEILWDVFRNMAEGDTLLQRREKYKKKTVSFQPPPQSTSRSEDPYAGLDHSDEDSDDD